MHHDAHPHLKIVKNPHLRALLVGLGWLCFAIGIIGIFLPLLPTTPFILLAAACFARGSPRFYHWLLENRFFGKHIRDWKRTGAIPLRAKITAIALMVISIGTSMIYFVSFLPAKIIMAVVGLGVVVYLIRLPTRQDSPD